MDHRVWTDVDDHRYNSAIIPTVAVNSFAYIVVDESFTKGNSWNISETTQAQHNQSSPSDDMTWMYRHGMD